MKKTFLQSALVIALILCASTAHTTFAAELAPKDIPSNVILDGTNTPSAQGIVDGTFPPVDVQEATKPSDETEKIDGVIFTASDHVAISTEALSDIFAAGETVTITKSVDGDIFAAGERVTVAIPDGAVGGSLRLIGSEVTIEASIQRNAFIVGDTVHIKQDAAITGDTHIYANRIIIDGTLEDSATLTGEHITINGTLSGKSALTAKHVDMTSTAVINANTHVYSENHVTQHSQVTGAEKITIHKTTTTHHNGIAWNNSLKLGLWLASTFFFLLAGILLLLLWPKWFEGVVLGMQKNPGATWTKGLLAFFLTPIVIIFLCFTILGIPLAGALMLAYIISVIIGRLFTGMLIGYELVHQHRFAHETKQRIAYFAIGYFILSCVMLVPIVGWIVKILAGIWGMGGMIHLLKKKTV